MVFRQAAAPIAKAAVFQRRVAAVAAAPAVSLPIFKLDHLSVRANRLPAKLQRGIEALSGLTMEKVRVHYNSPAHSRLGAMAFAKGNEVHLGPGQDRHLPHEAWHIVQQARNRVKPTVQAGSGTKINDDAGLER